MTIAPGYLNIRPDTHVLMFLLHEAQLGVTVGVRDLGVGVIQEKV